jgi:hypothetical protein
MLVIPRFVPGDDALEGWGRAKPKRVYIGTFNHLSSGRVSDPLIPIPQTTHRISWLVIANHRLSGLSSWHHAAEGQRGCAAPPSATLHRSPCTTQYEAEQHLSSETTGNNISPSPGAEKYSYIETFRHQRGTSTSSSLRSSLCSVGHVFLLHHHDALTIVQASPRSTTATQAIR